MGITGFIPQSVKGKVVNGILETSVSFAKKFVEDYEALTRKVAANRELGKAIALTSGTFDLLHIGHNRYFEMARRKTAEKMGVGYEDVALVVGVDADAPVRKRKGEGRPLVTEMERAEMMCAMGAIDLVTLAHEETAQWELMKAVRPDVLIITERMQIPGALQEEYRVLCGKIIELKSQATTSSSAKLRLAMVAVAEELGGKYEGVMNEVLSLIGQTREKLEAYAEYFKHFKKDDWDKE